MKVLFTIQQKDAWYEIVKNKLGFGTGQDICVDDSMVNLMAGLVTQAE